MADVSDHDIREESEPLSELQVERELERCVKRLDPMLLAADLARRQGLVRSGRVKIEAALPHVHARFVEATCAYHRGHYKERCTESVYRRVHNLLSQHTSEFDRHVLGTEGNISAWGQRAHREQLELQLFPDRLDFARLESLLLEDRLKAAFQISTGVNIEFFVSYTLLLFSNLINDERLGFRVDCGTRVHGGAINLAWVTSYLRLMSFTVAELGSEYKDRRASINKSYLKSLAKWAILDKPLITDGILVVAPIPGILIHTAMKRVFMQLANSGVRSDLDESFAKHVGKWLHELAVGSGGKLLCPDLLCQTEARCDYSIEWEHGVLLVECKTTYETPDFISDTAVRNSGLATSLAEAHHQIGITAQSLYGGRYGVYGIIVTPFDLPFPNTEWYLENAIVPNAKSGHWRSLAARPHTMSSHELEMLFMICLSEHIDVLKVLKKKEEHGHSVEWEPYLREINNAKKLRLPQFARDQAARVLQRARSLCDNA